MVIIIDLIDIYLLYRNYRVYKYREGFIKNNNLDLYSRLPDYNEMMCKWWEWDFDKFVKW